MIGCERMFVTTVLDREHEHQSDLSWRRQYSEDGSQVEVSTQYGTLKGGRRLTLIGTAHTVETRKTVVAYAKRIGILCTWSKRVMACKLDQRAGGKRTCKVLLFLYSLFPPRLSSGPRRSIWGQCCVHRQVLKLESIQSEIV